MERGLSQISGPNARRVSYLMWLWSLRAAMREQRRRSCGIQECASLGYPGWPWSCRLCPHHHPVRRVCRRTVCRSLVSPFRRTGTPKVHRPGRPMTRRYEGNLPRQPRGHLTIAGTFYNYNSGDAMAPLLPYSECCHTDSHLCM